MSLCLLGTTNGLLHLLHHLCPQLYSSQPLGEERGRITPSCGQTQKQRCKQSCKQSKKIPYKEVSENLHVGEDETWSPFRRFDLSWEISGFCCRACRISSLFTDWSMAATFSPFSICCSWSSCEYGNGDREESQSRTCRIGLE